MTEPEPDLMQLGIVWIEQRRLHVDVAKYARLYGMTLEDACVELARMLAEVLPGTPITWQGKP